MADIENMTVVNEGKAAVLYPASESVFYNPVQKFNRDLSILAIKEFLVVYKLECNQKLESNAKFKRGSGRRRKIDDEKQNDIIKDTVCEKIDNDALLSQEQVMHVSNSEGQNEEEPKEFDEKQTRPIRILEGLAATGLRSIRYALEIDGIDKIIANDFSAAAFESIKRNIEHNSVGNIIEPSLNDAGYGFMQISDGKIAYSIPAQLIL